MIEHSHSADQFEALLEQIERLARQLVERYPDRSALLWAAIERTRAQSITLDAALPDVDRNAADPDERTFFRGGARLIALLHLADETPSRVAEAEARVGRILASAGDGSHG